MPLEANVLKGLSKGLSNLLRHNERGQLAIDSGGWADIGDLTKAVAARSTKLGVTVDVATVTQVVEEDGRGRFEVSPDGGRIRALSGHSFPVTLGHPPYVPTGPLYFGTVVDMADRIETDGLVHSAKLKVRLLETQEAALDLAIQRGCLGPAVYEVDAERLALSGHPFERAPNGEVLTDRFGAGFLTRLNPAPSP